MESFNQNPEQKKTQEGIFDAEQLLDIEKMTLGGQEGQAALAAKVFLLVTELHAESSGKKEDDLVN